MIVVALLGGISLVVMNLTKQSNKASAKLQFDTDVTLTTNEINGILSDPVKCQATFGSTATPSNIVGKYYISTVSPGDQGYGNSGLKLTSYTLTGSAPDGVLTILYQNKNILKGSSGAANLSKKINLYIEGSPGAISKCRSLSTSTTDIWTRGTATDVNNIFYNGGVRAGDETQTNTCDSTTEGTQRYNKTAHAMEYCGYNAGPPVSYAWTRIGSGIKVCRTVYASTQYSAYSHQSIAGCNSDEILTGGGGGCLGPSNVNMDYNYSEFNTGCAGFSSCVKHICSNNSISNNYTQVISYAICCK